MLRKTPLLIFAVSLCGFSSSLSFAQQNPPRQARDKASPATPGFRTGSKPTPDTPAASTPSTNTSPTPAQAFTAQATAALEAIKAGDFEKAAQICGKAAKTGDEDCRWLLAGLHLNGKIKGSSVTRSVELLKEASANGHRASAFDLATILEKGSMEVKADPEKSRFYFQQAAEAGHPTAQYFAGKNAMTLEPRDEKAAFDWFSKAAEQGFADAKYELVNFYDKGLGGRVADPVRATKLCREAATTGSLLAVNEMGVRYQRGDGMERDDVGAIGWFSLAAQLGLTGGHINLGNCYEIGRGCKQDFKLAREHYSAAAKINHPVGIFLLAQLIEQGRGGSANPLHAYVLYSRAAALNHEEAGKRRDAIAGTLDKFQKEEAGKMIAAEFTPGL